MRAWGLVTIACSVGFWVGCSSSDDDGSGNRGGTGPAAGGYSGSGGAAKGGKGGKGGSSAKGGSAGDVAKGGSGGKGGSGVKGGKGGSGVKGGKGGSGGSDDGGTGGGSGGRSVGGLGGDAGTSGSAGTTSSGAGTAGTASGSSGSAGTSGGSAGTTSGGSAGDEAGGDSGTGGGGGETPLSVAFTIDTDADVHAISPLIYGVNPDLGTCAEAGANFGLCRLGGVRWSTYNWENNASNAGSPLCNQNDGALASSDTPAAAVTTVVDEASGIGAATLVTLPVLDYVAADKLPGSAAPECSGDVRDDVNYLATRFKLNAALKGSAFATPPDTADGSVYQDEFVAFLKASYPSGDILFALDNQPGLWKFDHPEVHPDAATYDEVVNRNVEYAKAVRSQWLDAKITGYVGYGWEDFMTLQQSSDATTLGPFLEYYLDAMAAAEIANADVRLIDYLDIHWYSDVYVGSDRLITNLATDALVRERVQAPRSLWDAGYVEESWIARDALGNQSIRLIPRLKALIDDHYPDTKLGISEWNLGGGTDISGAIAAADALGVFGREDLGLAAWSSVFHDDPFIASAFDVFRNYDGAGAKFGDVSVAAESSDVGLASVYASTELSADDHLTIVAINRADAAVDATLSLTSSHDYTTADVWLLTGASTALVAGSALAATGANAFAYAMPAYSVSVIVPKP